MTIPYEQLSLFFVSLFTIFSPFARVGGIASISGVYPRPTQRRMAAQVAGNYLAVMLAAVWIGPPLLELLGLTVPSLTATGGLALLLTAGPMMMQGEKHDEEVAEQTEQTDDWRSVIIVPLSFPLSVGGATAAIAIAISAQFPAVSDRLLISAVVLLMALVVGFTHLVSPLIGHRMQESGSMDILTRVSGIILSAIAIQLLFKGAVGLLTDLGVNLGI
ncbi:MarC family protein [Haloarchaeobius baliensis]|uniref:MarC family protein n=1 Tax=Haloarchaeobius baliensis TaxID=1670458 RepID=UPI003F883A99